MLPSNPPDARSLAVLLLLTLTPWALADDPGRTRVPVREKSKVRLVAAEAAETETSAAERWKNLKARHGLDAESVATPAAVQPKPKSARPAPVRPFPDADVDDELMDEDELAEEHDEREAASAPAAKAQRVVRPVHAPATPLPEEPLPMTDFESDAAWIGTKVPPPVETNRMDEDLRFVEAEEVSASQEDVPSPPLEEDAITEPVEERVADPGYATLPAKSSLRAPRKISEISPKYDLQVDDDIRTFARQQASQYGLQFGGGVYPAREFQGLVYQWEPSNLFHYPLYFEDPALERYGHTSGPVSQPIRSIARFGTQVVFLPYQMTIDPICTPKYALGWYRPGDCAPKLKYQPPLNATAAAVQAGVISGLIFAIP